MKVFIKLLIVALILNGTWRVGSAYMRHYQFKDAVHSTTLHRGKLSDAQVHDRVLELATEYDIPITDETLTITRKDEHTIVDGSYTQKIEVAPRFMTDWRFTIHVDTFIIEPEKLIPK